MAVKLSPAKPDDRYARLYFVFKDQNTIEARTEDQSDENMGWIDFWSEDARACKEAIRRMAGRIYVLGERREKRSKELTDEKALAELEEFNRLLVEGFAYRTKGWRLINSNGEPVDVPLTFENAKEVYGDDDHNLRSVIQDFLKDRTNFPLRASGNS